jgi:hypothetical protein
MRYGNSNRTALPNSLIPPTSPKDQDMAQRTSPRTTEDAVITNSDQRGKPHLLLEEKRGRIDFVNI